MAYSEEISSIDQGWESPGAKSIGPDEITALLREADKHVMATRLDILKYQDGLPIGHAGHEEYKVLTNEVDVAWNELRTSVEGISTINENEIDVDKDMEQVEAMLLDEIFNPDAFETFLARGVKNPEYQKALETQVKLVVPGKFGDRLITDGSWRKNLYTRLAESSAPLYENGPAMMRERNIKKLIALHEILHDETPSLVQQYQFSNFLADPDALDFHKKEYEKSSALDVSDIKFDASGNITGTVSFNFYHQEIDPNTKQPTGKKAKMSRSIRQEIDPESTKDEPKIKRFVHHDVFELPPNLMKNGIAAKMNEAALTVYDRLDVDAVELIANITIGGYAWATYGFGWDHQKMTLKQIEEIIESNKYAVIGVYENAGVPQEEIANIIARFTKAETEPEGITPQFLARIGEQELKLCRGKSDQWYTEQNFAKAIQNGTDEVNPDYQGPMHAGKIGMLLAKWDGLIELKPTGSQRGVNRKLFEKKIHKANDL